MVNWREELLQDIHAELGAKPITATLATVDGDHADARCVIIRQIHIDGTLRIVSDSRSQKNKQLRSNPRATAVLWFPQKRKQFRIAGNVWIVSVENDDNALRPAAWHELSDSARALFHWPPCGQPCAQADEFPRSIAADTPMPANFEVLLLTPVSVETLDLNPHPHLRIRWSQPAGDWISQIVNP
jgi:pyridoxamine 5'-phosphate oxidase